MLHLVCRGSCYIASKPQIKCKDLMLHCELNGKHMNQILSWSINRTISCDKFTWLKYESEDNFLILMKPNLTSLLKPKPAEKAFHQS